MPTYYPSVIFLLLCCLNCVLRQYVVVALPLFTNKRWIVDQNNNRVKLACVNWPTHLEASLAEGLSKKPVDEISKNILSMGFNCVRLTWSVALATDGPLYTDTVESHFRSLGLNDALAGIQANNPDFPKLSMLKAYESVVRSLDRNGVMVILDNHISKPGWCCSNDDGNGFFGDTYFDPGMWRLGLSNMAGLFKGVNNVVGMSIRNELRGERQNAEVWEGYFREAAAVINNMNPNVLIIVSGLNYDLDLSFLHFPLTNVTDNRKLLFEIHHYGVSDGNAWEEGNPNEMCGYFKNEFAKNAGFVLGSYPLFLSEFGGDLSGTNLNDIRFLNCMFSVIAELDLDWAWWGLQGSYYSRQGVVGMAESYGVLDNDWKYVRNEGFLQRLRAIQPPFQGPSNVPTGPYKVLFHPLSGRCVSETRQWDPITLGPCDSSEKWDYNPDNKAIMLHGTAFCLTAVQEGQPPELYVDCHIPSATWETISDSGLHLSANIIGGDRVCLDVNQYGDVVTNLCKCLEGDSRCDPASQWFKLVDVNHFKQM